MKSSVSSKGQVTLPAPMRQQLGLLPGTPVLCELRDGALLLRKGGAAEHPVDRVFGLLELSKPVDDLLEEMRGPVPVVKRQARAASWRTSWSGRAPCFRPTDS